VVTWHQIQYPRIAQPVGDPADWVEHIAEEFFAQWNPPTQQPVLPLDTRHLLPGYTCPLEPSNFVAPEHLFEWSQPTSQPVLPIEYRHQLQSYFTPGSPLGFVAPEHLFEWGQPISQPYPSQAEYRHQLQSVFEPPWELIISTPDLVDFATWVQPIGQPVLPDEYRYTLPYVFAQIDPDSGFVAASPFVRLRALEGLEDLREIVSLGDLRSIASLGDQRSIERG